MGIVNMCLYLYILLKPFYLLPSGNLQLSDGLIIIAFIVLMGIKGIDLAFFKKNKILILFLCLVLLINFIYYLIYQTRDFVMTNLYYIFILIGMIVFFSKLKDYDFLKKTYIMFCISIIIQLLIYLVGKGKFLGVTRYMGTFNDPNQFGFFIVISLMYIYTLENLCKKKRNLIIYFIGLFLIYLSASTGMILAIGTFLFIQMIYIIRNSAKSFKIKKILNKLLLRGAIILLIGLVIFGLYENSYKKMQNFLNKEIKESIIIKRVEKKFKKVDSGLMKERGLDKIINYPEYMIFGAGQGNYKRFAEDSTSNEIHSSLPSILFSYGIIPTALLLYWLYNNICKLNLKQMSVYIAILIESFTLLNQRQLLLWVLILFANLYKVGDRREVLSEK